MNKNKQNKNEMPVDDKTKVYSSDEIDSIINEANSKNTTNEETVLLGSDNDNTIVLDNVIADNQDIDNTIILGSIPIIDNDNDSDTLDISKEAPIIQNTQQVLVDKKEEKVGIEKMRRDSNGKKVKTKPSVKKRVLKALLVLFSIMLTFAIIVGVLLIGYFYQIYASIDNINDGSFWQNETSVKIHDIDGNYVTSVTSNYVDWVELKDKDGNYLVSEDYVNALIDTEDRTFQEHKGVDFVSMIKATLTTLTGGSRGGSTITMQLGKMLYLQEWYTVVDEEGYLKSSLNPIEYKLTQMAYALKIEQNYSKDEILENYMNSTYYGIAGNGIENASKYLYNKSYSKLELHEAAVIAGIPQIPNTYNPYVNPEGVEGRRNEVLAAMLTVEDITQEQYDAAVAVPITQGLVDDTKRKANDIDPYIPYLDLVLKEVDKMILETKIDVETGKAGIDVYTYMVPSLQKDVYNTFTNDEIIWQDEHIQGASAQIDTQNGAVYAIGSGREDRGMNSLNLAADNPRQPGSTSKPVVSYGPAIELMEWSTFHELNDKPTTYSGTNITVNNADLNHLGKLNMQSALGQSRNTTAVETYQELLNKVGYQPVLDFVAGLGYDDHEVNGSYAIGGWAYGTTPLEQAAAYAAFGNGGTYNEPKLIKYIDINENSALHESLGDKYTPKYKSEQVMKPSTAFMITQMLDRTNSAAQWYGGASSPGDVPNQSVKTGTSNWDSNAGAKADKPRDKWVVGYTPNVTTAVWIGYLPEGEKLNLTPNFYDDDNKEIYTAITRHAFYNDEKKLHDGALQPMPSDVIVKSLKRDSFPARSGGTPYYFIKGSDDLSKIEKELVSGTPGKQSFSTTVDGNKVSLNWTYKGDNKSPSWNIYVDGKYYNNVTETSIVLTSEDMAKFSSCKSSYKIQIALVYDEVEGTKTGKTVSPKKNSHCDPKQDSDDD